MEILINSNGQTFRTRDVTQTSRGSRTIKSAEVQMSKIQTIEVEEIPANEEIPGMDNFYA